MSAEKAPDPEPKESEVAAEAPLPEAARAEAQRPATAPEPGGKRRGKVECAINQALVSPLPKKGDPERHWKVSRSITTRLADTIRSVEKNRRSQFQRIVREPGAVGDPDVPGVARALRDELDGVRRSAVTDEALGEDKYKQLSESAAFKQRMQFLTTNSKMLQGSEEYGEEGRYAGEFLYGMRHGKGTHQWRGQVYDGEWKWDKWSGKGVLRDADGSTCTGTWSEGRQHGFCTITSQEGAVLFQGEFKNGKRDGLGRQLFDNGDFYDGGWCEGRLHERGIYYFMNGDKLYGMWDRGAYHGVGIFHHADGSISRRVYNHGLLMTSQDYEEGSARFGKALTREDMQRQTLDASFPRDIFRMS